MSDATAAGRESTVPRGGMWENQAIYGGKRLRDEFAASEAFILWGIDAVGEVPLDEGDGTKMVAKTELTVSRINEPDEQFQVGTLSGAIADMVHRASADDFPVEAYWSEVETKRGLNPATVLTAIRKWEGNPLDD